MQTHTSSLNSSNHSKLYVFSSSRALERFAFESVGGFLPTTLTLEGFFTQCLFCKAGAKAPKVIQKILLTQVLKEFEFSNKEKQVLFFEHNFLGFLETSPFLFALFSEMFGSKVGFERIVAQDIYGEYEDHLGVLEKIHQAYQQKLMDAGLYDFPRDYEILWGYLECFDEIHLFVDGFLSAFEWGVLFEISHKIPVILHLHLDMFNLPHFSRFFSDLQPNYAYVLALPKGEILQSCKQEFNPKVSFTSCESRVDECAVVVERVQKWLKEGIDPAKIAVVLPCEDFALFLQAIDEGGNFNYAMGREIALEKILSIGDLGGLGGLEDLFAELLARIKKVNLSSQAERKLIEILGYFEKNQALLHPFSREEILHLFIQECEGVMEDDNHGGKVRVIGMLETRGMEFERVVIVDFNQDNIPLLSDQDMFLNTKVRQSLEMPTLRDKQNLQKHYYLELFKNTQEIEVVFIENKLSTFVQEVGLENQKSQKNHWTLFGSSENHDYLEDEICSKLREDFVFSSSNLRVFDSCKRKFYFSYIQRIREGDEGENPKMKLGSQIHEILEKAFNEGKTPKEAQGIFEKEIFKLREQSNEIKEQMELDLSVRQMQNFWRNEISMPSQILALELDFEFEWEGVRFRGQIDRIDSFEDKIRVIDYKFSDQASNDVLQGAIYYLYAQKLYPNCEIEVYLLPLKSGNLAPVNVERGIEKIRDLIKEIKDEEEFEKSTSNSSCRDCPYKVLCNR